MNRGGGEVAPASFGKRTALHHMIPRVYRLCRMARWRLHHSRHERSAQSEIAQPPQLRPAFGGGAHTPLPLPGRKLLVLADEATSAKCANGLAYTWVIDVREPTNPVSIATLPTPAEEDFCAKALSSGRIICMRTGRDRCRAKT